jgi:hypothetical protein
MPKVQKSAWAPEAIASQRARASLGAADSCALQERPQFSSACFFSKLELNLPEEQFSVPRLGPPGGVVAGDKRALGSAPSRPKSNAMNQATEPSRRKPWPAWSIALLACSIGSSLAWAGLEAASRAAPGTGLAVAASQALRAAKNGQGSLMRSVFEQEMNRSLKGGAFDLPEQTVGLRLTFAAPGTAHSVSRWRPNAHPPCRLELSIDGAGSPSLEKAFEGFQGRLDGADARTPTARAVAAAFTVAHELGHCALHLQGQKALEKAVLEEMRSASQPADPGRVRAFFAGRFGQALFHEGFSDAAAVIALARRMDDRGFASATRGLWAKRQASAASRLPEGGVSPYQTLYALRETLPMGRSALAGLDAQGARAVASRAAARGALAFLNADLARAQALGFAAPTASTPSQGAKP